MSLSSAQRVESTREISMAKDTEPSNLRVSLEEKFNLLRKESLFAFTINMGLGRFVSTGLCVEPGLLRLQVCEPMLEHHVPIDLRHQRSLRRPQPRRRLQLPNRLWRRSLVRVPCLQHSRLNSTHHTSSLLKVQTNDPPWSSTSYPIPALIATKHSRTTFVFHRSN